MVYSTEHHNVPSKEELEAKGLKLVVYKGHWKTEPIDETRPSQGSKRKQWNPTPIIDNSRGGGGCSAQDGTPCESPFGTEVITNVRKETVRKRSRNKRLRHK